MLKSKQFHDTFLIGVLLLLNNIHVLAFFYFRARVYVWPSNCCVMTYIALRQKYLESPGLQN